MYHELHILDKDFIQIDSISHVLTEFSSEHHEQIRILIQTATQEIQRFPFNTEFNDKLIWVSEYESGYFYLVLPIGDTQSDTYLKIEELKRLIEKYYSIPRSALMQHLPSQNPDFEEQLNKHLLKIHFIGLLGYPETGIRNLFEFLVGQDPITVLDPKTGLELQYSEYIVENQFKIYLWEYHSPEEFETHIVSLPSELRLFILVITPFLLEVRKTKLIVDQLHQLIPDIPILGVSLKTDKTSRWPPAMISRNLGIPVEEINLAQPNHREHLFHTIRKSLIFTK